MFPDPVDPRDEAAHPPGPEPLWGESWYFDFSDRAGTIGGYVRLGLYPRLGVAWYWACLVGEGRRPVLVVDHEVPLPSGRSLEVRSSGLWADLVCETPLDHWSLGLEAFGVALDDPADAYRGMVGERTPLGFDLEWETDGQPYGYPAGIDRYEVPCRVHGEVLVGQERIELDGVGQRDHSWGVRDWWTTGWCWSALHLDDGAHLHAVVPTGVPIAFGYDQTPGRPVQVIGEASAVLTEGPEGIPSSLALSVDERQLAVEPVGWGPVLLVAPDGRESRFPRALVRATDASGTPGVGWVEVNQPPVPDAGVGGPGPVAEQR